MSSKDEIRIKFKIDSDTNQVVLLKKEVNSLGQSFNKTDSFANTFMKRLNIAGHIYAGYQALKQTLGEIYVNGVKVNREFETINNSLSTMIMVSSKNVDSLGNQLTVLEKQALAGAEAGKSMERLLEINAKTPHTFKQTAQLFDAMYLGMRKVGASTEDMVEITEKLSIAVGNKVSFDAMLSAMDGLSTGTVELSSDMGRFLNAIGLSNDEIKNSIDVVQLFKDKLSGFEAIDSFDTRLSNLTNSYDLLTKTISNDLFERLSDDMINATNILNKLNKYIIDFKNNINDVEDVKRIESIEILEAQAKKIGKEWRDSEEIITGGYKNIFSLFQSKTIALSVRKDAEEKLKAINERIRELLDLQEKAKGSTVYNFDDTEIQDLVKNTLYPYESGLTEINKKWETHFNLMLKNGKDTSGLIQAWTKDITEYDKKIEDKTKKEEKQKSILTTNLSSYKKYYEKISEFQTSWAIEEANIRKEYIDLAKDDIDKLINISKKEYFFNLKFNPILNDFKSLDINSLNELEDFALETEWKLLLDDASQETINKVYALTEEKKTQLKQSLSFTPETTQLQAITDEWTLALELYPNKMDEINTHYLTKFQDIQNKNVDNLDNTFKDFTSDFGSFLASELSNSLTTLFSGGSISGGSLASSVGGFVSSVGSSSIINAFKDASSLSAGFSAIPGWGIAATIGGSLLSGIFGKDEKVDNSETLVAMGKAMAEQLINDMGYGDNPLDDFNSAIEEATKTLAEFNNNGSGLSVKIKTLVGTEEYQSKKAEDLNKEYLNTVNKALMFAFTETGAMLAGMAGTLKGASDEAKATAKAAHNELESTLLDSASSTLDYSLYTIDELNNLIKEIDYDEYANTVKAINDIAIEIKNTGLITEEQISALAELYSEENFINYQDALDIKEAIEEQKNAIKELEEDASKFTKNIFDDFIDSVKNLSSFVFDLKDLTESTINSISISNYDQTESIIEFNKLKAEMDSYFAGNSNLTEEEVSKKYNSLLSFANNISSSSPSLKNEILNYLDNNLGLLEDKENVVRVNVIDGLGQLEGLTKDQTSSLKSSVADGKLSLSELMEIKGLSTEQISSLVQMLDSTDAIAKDDTINELLLSNIKGFKELTEEEQEVKKTNIINGLDGLENYSKNQLDALKKSLDDTVITNKELSNIAGLTQEQKDNIILVANNSDYFSTESTLGLMSTLLQYQLEELKKTNDKESSNLSQKSFEYGDYIGKQEQIDLSHLFGRAYDDSIKDIIVKLQGLSLSSNPTEELKKLLDYDGYGDKNYRTALANTILKLDDYIPTIDIGSTINSIDNEISNYKKQESFLAKYKAAQTKYVNERQQSDTLLSGFSGVIQNEEDFNTNKKATLNAWGQLWFGQNYKKYEKEFDEAQDAYNNYNQLAQQKIIMGYQYGTSEIPDNQLAMFNQNEIVVPSSFSEGIREGVLSLGNNNEIIEELKKSREVNLMMLKYIQKLEKSNSEMNLREKIKVS